MKSPWQLFLDRFYCAADRQGNRPCNRGFNCGRCKTESATKEYTKWCMLTGRVTLDQVAPTKEE